MNQRIRELANQAENYAHEQNDKFGLNYIREYEKKFAELIVQECIDVVDVGGEFVSRPKMVERLKEHFGVEE